MQLVAVSVAGLALGAVAILVPVADAPPGERVVSALVHGLSVAAPLTVSLWTLSRRRADRFAWLLLIGAMPLALSALASSPDPALYSLGRVSQWLGELWLVFLMLAFPSGRLRRRVPDRAVVAAGVAVVSLLYLPTALLVQHYPVPAPGATCGLRCAPNAFALTSSEPGVMSVIRPLREVITALIFIAVLVILVERARGAGPLARRVLMPVVVIAMVRAVVYIAYVIARGDSGGSRAVEILGWTYALLLVGIALAFGAGLIARALYGARVLERLMIRLGADASAADLRAGIAEALEDPTVRVVYRLPGSAGRWVDETGWPVEAPHDEPGASVTLVGSEGRRMAAVLHDAGAGHDPALLQAAASYAFVTLENRRLVDRLRSTAQELTDSRARVVAVADETRHRIERDLHDGAQQRLIALRVQLALAGERAGEPAAPTAALLDKLGGEVEQTIEEVRALARGIYPSLLAEHGLADALREVAIRAALPTTVDARGIGRYRPELESAVYFACAEALQNAGKHARGASHAAISLSVDGRLRFEVSDDGAGMAPAEIQGRGLTNLRDRLAAVGGRLEIESALGQGTRVVGSVPLP